MFQSINGALLNVSMRKNALKVLDKSKMHKYTAKV